MYNRKEKSATKREKFVKKLKKKVPGEQEKGIKPHRGRRRRPQFPTMHVIEG